MPKRVFPIFLVAASLASVTLATGCLRDPAVVNRNIVANTNANEEVTLALLEDNSTQSSEPTKDQNSKLHLTNLAGDEQTVIKTNAEGPDFRFAAGRAYYYNQAKFQVEAVDQEGNITPLEFTRTDSKSFYPEFLVAPDGQHIFWSTTTMSNDLKKSETKLFMAKINGQEQQTLIAETNDGERYIKPLQWEAATQKIYYSLMPGGIGGYILFTFSTNVTVYDLATKQKTLLNSEGFLTPDAQKIYYFEKDQDGLITKLAVKNLVDNKTTSVDLPATYSQGGAFVFQPTGNQVAFSLALGKPEEEKMATFRFDPANQDVEEIIPQSNKNLQAKDWLVDGQIIFNSYNYILEETSSSAGTYLAQNDGSSLRKISAYYCVGVWPVEK